MFKKSIIFGDIHFGKKGNSNIFNQDCLDFLEWMCEHAKQLKAETCIFLGDWHNDRKYVHVKTLVESIKGVELLSKTFDIVIMILGNHDLYYRDRREIHSLEFAKEYDNICVIEEPLIMEDCAFFPWMINKEKSILHEYEAKYAFGHFEIEKFLMNNYMECQNSHAFHIEDFKNYETVFSGHFHKRQQRGNILYIGNTFPHDFSDLNDNQRGFCFLEYGKEPIFYDWPDQPSYKQLYLSNILDDFENLQNVLQEKTYAKIVVDIDLTFEKTLKLREFFIKELGCREIRFIPKEIEINEMEINDNKNEKFLTVDEMVVEGLKTVESPTIDNNLLIQIYNELNNEVK